MPLTTVLLLLLLENPHESQAFPWLWLGLSAGLRRRSAPEVEAILHERTRPPRFALLDRMAAPR